MKTTDIIASVLLIVGGLNWGMVGLLNFNIVTAIFGSVSIMSTIVYLLVAISAIYLAMVLGSLQRRPQTANIK
ncbi:MAG: DUF378 domain-containing protein [Ignavibacteriales bacterium]|nr:DUF378 domain-containing protein [Ignavibacteriales bacterium]